MAQNFENSAPRLRETRSINTIVGADIVPRLQGINPHWFPYPGAGLLYPPYHKTIYFPNVSVESRLFNGTKLREHKDAGGFLWWRKKGSKDWTKPSRFAFEPANRAVEIAQTYTNVQMHTSASYYWLGGQLTAKHFWSSLWDPINAMIKGTSGDHSWILGVDPKGIGRMVDRAQVEGGWGVWGPDLDADLAKK